MSHCQQRCKRQLGRVIRFFYQFVTGTLSQGRCCTGSLFCGRGCLSGELCGVIWGGEKCCLGAECCSLWWSGCTELCVEQS